MGLARDVRLEELLHRVVPFLVGRRRVEDPVDGVQRDVHGASLASDGLHGHLSLVSLLFLDDGEDPLADQSPGVGMPPAFSPP